MINCFDVSIIRNEKRGALNVSFLIIIPLRWTIRRFK